MACARVRLTARGVDIDITVEVPEILSTDGGSATDLAGLIDQAAAKAKAALA